MDVERIIPIFDRILVQRVKTLEGKDLAGNEEGGVMHCIVVAVGPGGKNIDTGTTKPMTVKAGDQVLLPEHGGMKLTLKYKNEYFFYRESDILS